MAETGSAGRYGRGADGAAVELVVLGVPSSAGAHHAGQELAPAALRAQGFVDRLRAAGLAVTDLGDVAGEVFTSDTLDSTARNIDAVVRVARGVADAVEQQARAGRTPILLGGDCTLTLGVVAGLQRVHDDVRVAYFDGDADLDHPARTRSGILDATGAAHLLGIADTPLARIGRGVPMLADHQLVLLGYDPTDEPDSIDPAILAARPTLRHVTDAQLRTDPVGRAEGAVVALSDADAVVVHFDVDAVDSRDLPLGNFPHYGSGVPLGTAAQVLETLLTMPTTAAITLTEINPSYDPAGNHLARYVDAVGTAITHALARRSGDGGRSR
ncbi:MAG: arginase family protein [Actinocatenispora sp.]